VNFLEKIVSRKRIEVEEAKKRISLNELRNSIDGCYSKNDFRRAIARRKGEPVKVIAEIKRASPSKGIIDENIVPVKLAVDYREGGASAISILTESNFFKGSFQDMQSVRSAIHDIPLLRKDFIVDEYQIYESVKIGADAILLIVSALDEKQLKQFISVAKTLHLDSLVEVHNEKELDVALSSGVEIVGVNNRNLTTFEVSNSVSEELSRKFPPEVVSVSESGINNISGIQTAFQSGYHAVLIGEHFMRAKDRAAEVKKFAMRIPDAEVQ